MSYLFAIIFTLLVSFIIVPAKAKSSLRAIFGWSLVLYIAIYITGNTFATLLAGVVLASELPAIDGALRSFLEAFAGVFAFQGVVGNINITIFGQGVLTIEEWINMARDQAVSSAADRQVIIDDRRADEYADVLKKLDPVQLNTYVVRYLGPSAVADLEAEAKASNADPAHSKAFAVADKNPAFAKTQARKMLAKK